MTSTPPEKDFLALERTHLANERTFLSYIRTAVSIAAVGVVALHFLGDPASRMFGVIAIIVGTMIFVLGLFRFRGGRTRIRNS